MSGVFTGRIGFCIGQDFKRPEHVLLETLKGIGTPALSDGLNKFNTMDPLVKPICDDIRIAGPALTVRMRPGDNLMLHKAIGMAQPGDVIVVDTCGCKNYSILGDLMASAAFKRGIGGIIIDGAIRDIADLKAKKFPVFAKYITPGVGDKDGPGEINLPISCAGVPVLPGNIIVGDCNGVVVLAFEVVDQIISGAKKKIEYEKKRAKEIEEGITVKPDIDEKLRSVGIIG
jgi:regulator of RNase E activity RraA